MPVLEVARNNQRKLTPEANGVTCSVVNNEKGAVDLAVNGKARPDGKLAGGGPEPPRFISYGSHWRTRAVGEVFQVVGQSNLDAALWPAVHRKSSFNDATRILTPRDHEAKK